MYFNFILSMVLFLFVGLRDLALIHRVLDGCFIKKKRIVHELTMNAINLSDDYDERSSVILSVGAKYAWRPFPISS